MRMQWILIMALFVLAGSLISGPLTTLQDASSILASKTLPENPNQYISYEQVDLKDIYLAGGCFWGVEAYLARIYGVREVSVGYANGTTDNPTYREVIQGHTGYVETVHLRYDPKRVTLETLLHHFFGIIDPTLLNRQGNDIGTHYRTGIYYDDECDRAIIKRVVEEEQKKYEEPIVTEVLPIARYYLAEEYHQQYLEKNPSGYCHVDFSSLQEPDFITIDLSLYQRPDDTILREKLTELQYYVTQEDGTEHPFQNKYWDHEERGLYVDIVSREPLFSSRDKYNSGTGWPSFTKSILPEVIVYKEDYSYGMIRTEVRSLIGDSHLGHVFPDGPEGGDRYCINSAALHFIPVENMEREGYGSLLPLVL